MKEKKKGFDSMLEEYAMADEEHLYQWKCVYNASNPPKAKPGTCIMSKQSEFYRWRPAEALLKENLDYGGSQESFDMVFPSKL